jgi:glyoxylase-like metal-dependent hydrolase (beta-lactamase superfamily II)
MKWLIGLGVVIAIVGAAFWYFLLDATPPAQAEGEFDLAAYRALVAGDAPETLPTDVRIEFIGENENPAFAAVAGDFSGDRTFAYVSFQIVAPEGSTIIDGAVDRDTLNTMSDNTGSFDETAYTRVLEAEKSAARVMITHEHLDHVMAITRHPEPDAIAPHLQLTRAQLDGLPEHAPNGVLAPSIANVAPIDLATPTRLGPGIVAAAAPGHSPGTIVIYVRTTTEREYLFIGDIAWLMASVERPQGRPRLIRTFLPGVDPDRPAVLRQLRALHDIAAAEPELVIVPAHDDAYLRRLAGTGALRPQFVMTTEETAAPATESAPASP